jgi:hypothetical protein
VSTPSSEAVPINGFVVIIVPVLEESGYVVLLFVIASENLASFSFQFLYSFFFKSYFPAQQICSSQFHFLITTQGSLMS